MKTYPQAKNIKIKFAGKVVTLASANDQATILGGVQIRLRKDPAGELTPVATIPNNALEKYKHCRPEVISVKWE